MDRDDDATGLVVVVALGMVKAVENPATKASGIIMERQIFMVTFVL
jgi:hypothetical protein